MPAPPTIHIGPVTMDGTSPVFILGPCVIQDPDTTWEIAEALAKIAARLQLRWVFKASYDKANRTSDSAFRGLGLDAGCQLLAEIGHKLATPVTTDVHSPEEATRAARYVDLLQIPAFLCRQTDLIVAAAQTGRAVNVKKGQFLSPFDLPAIAKKLQSAGCTNFFFTERGTTFGYQNLVADMRSLAWARAAGYRIVFDATHSVQRPGGLGDRSGGDGEMAPVLARAAVAAGCDGLFIETHPRPEESPSDGPNMVPLHQLENLLATLLKIHQAATCPTP